MLKEKMEKYKYLFNRMVSRSICIVFYRKKVSVKILHMAIYMEKLSRNALAATH